MLNDWIKNNILSPSFSSGVLTVDGRRTDVAQELVFYMDITDETNSHYINVNLRQCLDSRVCQQLLKDKDQKFINSNKMNHINGYVYGNMPAVDVCEGEDVAIYAFALGNGIHTLQIYGQTFVMKKHR